MSMRCLSFVCFVNPVKLESSSESCCVGCQVDQDINDEKSEGKRREARGGKEKRLRKDICGWVLLVGYVLKSLEDCGSLCKDVGGQTARLRSPKRSCFSPIFRDISAWLNFKLSMKANCTDGT